MTICSKKAGVSRGLIPRRQASFRIPTSQHSLTDCFDLPTWRPLPRPAPAQALARHWPLGHRRFPPRPTTLPFGRDVHRTAYTNEITELDVALTILALIDALYDTR